MEIWGEIKMVKQPTLQSLDHLRYIDPTVLRDTRTRKDYAEACPARDAGTSRLCQSE